MISSALCYQIFEKSIADFHIEEHVDTPIKNPYKEGSVETLLYLKNWIDTVQWHLEDIIRDTNIQPDEALKIKRRIDASNQHRTDTVEKLDDFFLFHFKDVKANADARLNSETPAWLLDRMSILTLKIYHMREQTLRTDTDEDHLIKCRKKLDILLEQKSDMGTCFDQLLEEVLDGRRYMKVYRQMKMYNDETLNPVLYKS